MNLASYTRRAQSSIAIHQATALHNHVDQDREIQDLSTLSDRFLKAHARLNDIELALHDSIQSDDRMDLLRTLEEARMEYSDARFALSTRDFISSRR